MTYKCLFKALKNPPELIGCPYYVIHAGTENVQEGLFGGDYKCAKKKLTEGLLLTRQMHKICISIRREVFCQVFEERWLIGSAPDCKSVVLGSNPASPQHTANSVSPEAGSHLG
jgi:hypothetical protein